MSNWDGRAYKGAVRDLRQERAKEAARRNAQTPHERTKAHRLERCVECGHTAAEPTGRNRKRTRK